MSNSQPSIASQLMHDRLGRTRLRKRRFSAAGAAFAIAAIALSGCAPTPSRATPTSEVLQTPTNSLQRVHPSITATAVVTPQATPTFATYGPDHAAFPANVNPLSGLPVIDTTLLKIPAVLVSISHFPVTARPQAGLSFAPFVYEFSITGGETRFLAAFYGEAPAPDVPVVANCAVRTGAFVQTATVLGGRAWLDANGNGIRDLGEGGIPGMCVRLFDSQGNLLQSTTTDSNGMYGFNVVPGKAYSVRFQKPASLDLAPQNVADDNRDSDVDPATAATSSISVTTDLINVDAGFVPNATFATPTPDAKTAPKAEIGPVRSGRLLYAYIGAYYQDSCLIYAFASPEVLARLPKCSFVAHNESGGGEMLPIERMRAVAEDNMRRTTSRPFDYATLRFDPRPPAGGTPASQINVFFSSLDQSGWTYDPLYQAYLRYVDSADPKARGVLHPEIDRLTGRQLHVENVIVIVVDTDVITPTILDIHLDQGNTGPAMLFRDGRAFPITWSTRAGDYEQHTGLRRPIQFLNPNGTPAALRPGHTWVIIVTPYSAIRSVGSGAYTVIYGAPEGEAR